MKYVSFSLWGNKPIYNVGAIRNAELMKKIYPDWKMIVYYDDTVPIETIEQLKILNVEVINMVNSEIYSCFWRFLVSDKYDCDYAVFRDCDSRISYREKYAVDEWLNSKKIIHVMRDHPAHGIPYGNDKLGILAGMWGVMGRKINMKKSILDFIKDKIDTYGIDQSFLVKIYDYFYNNRCTHDEFFEKNPFPTQRDGYRFIGERINVDETPLTNDYEIFKYEK